MAILTASDLAKDIAGKPLLRDVSLQLERRERLTIAGRNGAGKTTLLRMLAGETSVDGGVLAYAKGVRVALHDQRPPRSRDISLRDYVVGGCKELVALEEELESLAERMAAGEQRAIDAYGTAQARLEHAGGWAWRDRATATVHGLGFGDDELDRRLDTFSGGELTRASLARALAAGPDLLLLDEPTNHLDIESLEWLERTLVDLDAAVVLVAHDRWFLEAVGTAVLELEAGRGRFFSGPWHAWREEAARRELALGRAIERQQAEIARMERFVERFRAKATKARQAQSRVKRLEKIERVEAAPRDRRALGFSFTPPKRSGRVVLELEGGRVEAGDKLLIDGAELWLERGEHVNLVGANGSGKTTLIETLAGRRELGGGRLRRGHNVELGYLTQHADELGAEGARTVLEACQRATGLKPQAVRALLGRFLFGGDEAEKPLDGLSGGERRRLSLAIVVASGANFLILDEPTNHLDLDGREALEDALRGFEGSLLLVSHDRALLSAVGTRTVAVEDRALRSYAGGWEEYVRVREERRASRREAIAAEVRARKAAPRKEGSKARSATGGSQNGGPKEQRGGQRGSAKPGAGGLSHNRRREVEKVERRIEEAEAALVALEDELGDPAAWESPERSAESGRRHEDARGAVDALYKRLEGLGA
jgi:ATP-binding cassette subfamily F protein 3